MQLSPVAQATILLTVPFDRDSESGFKCLSPNEWNSLGSWLKKHEMDPSDLLKSGHESILREWSGSSAAVEPMKFLLGRGVALGLVLDRWQRAGIWIITRSDIGYPKLLKDRLGIGCPSVIFGCGNRDILNTEGIAIVGPRNASAMDIGYSKTIGEKFATEGISVVSGGARGIDQSAMFGALERSGRVLGVLAEELLKTSMSSKYRKHIASRNLLLISAEHPEAGFSAANAMIRNQNIYCLSRTSVVVNCTPNKGGTWNGAIRNLKANWVPVWVGRNEDAMSGNSILVQKGAHWIPDELHDWKPLQDEDAFAELEARKNNGCQLELQF